MIAKHSSTCKVTGKAIVAGVTNIEKINGVWQFADPSDRTPFVAPAPATTPAPVAQPTPKAIVPNGYYTVVFGDEHLTLRLRQAPSEWANYETTQIVSVLTGPNNSSDYTAFASLVGGNLKVWGKFKSGYESWKSAFAVLSGATPEDLKGFGEIYALVSGNCYRCGRLLTDPTSIQLGIGPTCRQM